MAKKKWQTSEQFAKAHPAWTAFANNAVPGAAFGAATGLWALDAWLKQAAARKSGSQDAANVAAARKVVERQEAGVQRDLETAQRYAQQSRGAIANQLAQAEARNVANQAVAMGGPNANPAAVALAASAQAYNQNYQNYLNFAQQQQKAYEEMVPDRRVQWYANQRQQQEMKNNEEAIEAAYRTGNQMVLDNIKAQQNPWGSAGNMGAFGMPAVTKSGPRTSNAVTVVETPLPVMNLGNPGQTPKQQPQQTEVPDATEEALKNILRKYGGATTI